MIPFLDLKSQYRSISGEVNAAIARVLESCQFVLGDEVEAFEKEFASYSGARAGIAVNSGTSALHLSLLAAGIGPGDEVITVPFTFVATVASILYAGARPVLVDIEPRRYTMDPEKLAAAWSPRTKAIIPVHLYGQPADMDPILEFARSRKLVVIEDASQAHGAEIAGRRVGGLGDFGCFSFYPSKNLGAYGEAGIVLTNDPEHERTLRMLRDWGQREKHNHVLKGYNNRMEGIQGAILRVKLRHLERWIEARRRHAASYDRLLADSPAGFTLPAVAGGVRHVYHLYTLLHEKRDAVRAALDSMGVQTGVHYPVPIHLQRAYSDLGYGRGDFPVSERAASQVLSLPLYPEMPDDTVTAVHSALKRSVDA